MIVLWVTLFVLHGGYALVPVTSVQLGDSAAFTCVLPKTELPRNAILWYKQSIGDTLRVIWAVRESQPSKFAPGFNNSRWKVDNDGNFSNLTILKTMQEDEGIYHCAVTEWQRDSVWSGTFLLVKGDTQRSSNYMIVQENTFHPEQSVTFQCSVFSDSSTKTCPGGLSMFWFRAGSQESHPNIIYTDGNRQTECEKTSEPQKKCVYHLSKNISSFDAGTYYCGVATCGEILFGNGTTEEKGQRAGYKFTALVIVIICLVISVIVNFVLICCQTPRTACERFKGNSSSQAKQDDLSQTVDDSTEGGYDLNYAALHFSGRKTARGQKKKNELKSGESVYSQVKCRM